MTILYEGVAGSGPCLWGAIVLWIFAGIFTISVLYTAVKESDASYLIMLLFSCLVIIIGFFVFADKTYTEVYATIDDSVSWTEVNEKYELIKQKGEMYIFKEREKDETQEGL